MPLLIVWWLQFTAHYFYISILKIPAAYCTQMDFSYFAVVIVVHIFISTGISQQESYSRDTELGIISRIDLLNALKAALESAKPKPTKIERKAALKFAKFLNSARSNDYLEAFYATHSSEKVNTFSSFLNGILFSGNPSMRVWKAAEILAKMLKSKTKTIYIEKLRQKLKASSKSRAGGTMIKQNKKKDFVQIFKDPHYFDVFTMTKYLKPKLKNLRKCLTSTTNPNIDQLVNILVLYVLKELDSELYSQSTNKFVLVKHNPRNKNQLKNQLEIKNYENMRRITKDNTGIILKCVLNNKI